jgi:phosphoadenosine phosphosulfate reductase
MAQIEQQHRPPDQELKALSASFEGRAPEELLREVLTRYGSRAILACSFGAEDVVLVDMIQRIRPGTPLFYLDTDFLFEETYEVRDRIVAKYGLTAEQAIQVKSLLTPDQQAAEHGPVLWARDPDLCCQLRKVEPLSRVLRGYAAWITGIRRDQAPSRAHAALIDWDSKFGLVKVNPLASWSAADVWRYIQAHDVPYNPLHERNYPSIGCTHCTAPILPGEDPRSGRWKSFAKTECGLHK